MKKKSKIRKLLPWIGFAVLALVLAVLPRLARSAETGEKAEVLQAVATVGEVENTLGGGGTLTAEDPIKVQVPASVEIQKYLVENGEHVEAGQQLAEVDRVTLLDALSQVQKSIDSITEKMQVAMLESGFSWLEAQAVGRVKAVYARVDDDAMQVVLNHGALAVVSLDGMMVARVETELPVQPGDLLTVRLSDGKEVPGRAETVLNGLVSVTLSDLGPTIGETVTVLTSDGKEVGSADLEVHSPWSVMATQGKIAAVQVYQDQMVYAGTRMICLNLEEGNEAYRALVSERRDYEKLMEELFALYMDNTVTAPEAGLISGVDKSLIKKTAAFDTKPVLKLLANEEGGSGSTPNDRIDPSLSTLFLVTEVNGMVIRGVPVDVGSSMPEAEKLRELFENPVTIDLKKLGENGSITAPRYLPGSGLFGPQTGDVLQLDNGTNPTKLQWIEGLHVELEKIIEYIQSLLMPDYSDFDFGDLGGFGGGIPEKVELYPLEKATILSVTPETSMTVTMNVDELDIAFYEPGQHADIIVDALPNQNFTAVVEEVAAVGKNSGGNSKYTVKLRLDRAPDMLNGMNASVVVHRDVQKGVLLPVAAVYDRGSESFVYTAVDRKTGQLLGELPVVTGVSDGEMVEIVEGLAEGQTVFYEYYLPPENE